MTKDERDFMRRYIDMLMDDIKVTASSRARMAADLNHFLSLAVDEDEDENEEPDEIFND